MDYDAHRRNAEAMLAQQKINDQRHIQNAIDRQNAENAYRDAQRAQELRNQQQKPRY